MGLGTDTDAVTVPEKPERLKPKKPLKPLQHSPVSINESSSYDGNKYPHYFSMRMDFKTIADRNTFKKKMWQVLHGEL